MGKLIRDMIPYIVLFDVAKPSFNCRALSSLNENLVMYVYGLCDSAEPILLMSLGPNTRDRIYITSLSYRDKEPRGSQNINH